MKIRIDFVTNSSSSSFIIALKDVVKEPDFENIPVWAKKLIKNYFVMITRSDNPDRDIIYTVEELEKYFYDNYGAKPEEINKDSWMKGRFKKMKKAVESGYNVCNISVDYSDETGNAFFAGLPKKDDGCGFYLLDSDDY
jgi:hypothetical protein